MSKTRAQRSKEMEEGLKRVQAARASYQRKIIGTVVVCFIILIIVCALLPSDESAAFRNVHNTKASQSQSQIFHSMEENFK